MIAVNPRTKTYTFNKFGQMVVSEDKSHMNINKLMHMYTQKATQERDTSL